ncbi:MAG: stage II sporulation protein M [Pirellulales bacterium]
MKVAELIEQRRSNWQELEQLCTTMENKRKRSMTARSISRFATLYRGACADLALADSYQLPPNIVEYLHQLVGRAHNQLYRSRRIDWSGLVNSLMFEVPSHIFHDRCVQVCFCLFWSVFLICGYLASGSDSTFADQIVGAEQLDMMSDMHSRSIGNSGFAPSAAGSAFYIQHNTSIGLQCFALGITVIGGLGVLLSNASTLGTVFGYMASPNVPDDVSNNFFEFVTAHGPFELTAIILSAGAGLRLGMALINPRFRDAELQGHEQPNIENDLFDKMRVLTFNRVDSLKIAARRALPVMGSAAVMFGLAAMIEAWISPSPLPLIFKQSIAVISSGMLTVYFILLGFPKRGQDAVR